MHASARSQALESSHFRSIGFAGSASGKEVAVRDSSLQKLTNYSISSVQDTQRYVRIRSQIDEYAEHVDPRMRVASPRCGFRPVDEMVLGLRHSGCRSSIRAPLDESIARGLALISFGWIVPLS